jgi:hypothetical protein
VINLFRHEDDPCGVKVILKKGRRFHLPLAEGALSRVPPPSPAKVKV